MVKSNPRADPAGPRTMSHTPSFIDKLLAWIKRLPGPYWLICLIFLALQSSLFHILAWLDGWLPAFTFHPSQVLFPIWLWIPLAAMIYLNDISVEALNTFRPLLALDEHALAKLKTEFTTMPPRGALLSSAFWAIVYLLMMSLAYEELMRTYNFQTWFGAAVLLEGLISFAVGGAIYYHSLRQLRLVNRTVKIAKPFNLFQLDPVYAFSRLTARTGVVWMLMLILTLMVYPVDIFNLPFLVLQMVLALAAFVLPLRMVNDRLVTGKRQMLGEHNRRVEATLARLGRCLDVNEIGEMGNFESALAALTAEREILAKIPTWPWRPGTLTGFLSAVGLPILLFLIQMFLEGWVGG